MERFRIDVDDAVLDDLRQRLARTRWPDAVTDDWTWGTPPSPLRALVDHWLDGYDWRATEARWNGLDHYRVRVDGLPLHVVRAGTPGATPLVLLHGWPDGFLRFEKVLPLLADRFDLFLPSLPGFGFSDHPERPGWGAGRAADAIAAAMSEFGVAEFAAHGADVGSGVAEALAVRHPDRILALHLGDVPAWRRYGLDGATLSDAEQAYADGMNAWFASEGAYAMLHRTKPQTLAYALADSPVALLAWIVEKLRAWSDNDGDVTTSFPPDEILDLVTLYWVTGTGPSSVRYYRDSALHPLTDSARPIAPTGLTVFPRDIAVSPRDYAERFFDVRRYTLADRGGHFGPWEEPELFAADLRAFFDGLEAGSAG